MSSEYCGTITEYKDNFYCDCGKLANTMFYYTLRGKGGLRGEVVGENPIETPRGWKTKVCTTLRLPLCEGCREGAVEHLLGIAKWPWLVGFHHKELDSKRTGGCTWSDALTAELVPCPTKEQVMTQAALTYKCKNCDKLFGPLKGEIWSEQRCQHCDADIEGKVYPKKREEPRIVKQYDFEPDERIDSILRSLIADHPQVIKDYAKNPGSIGKLVGLAKRQMSISPGEIKSRLERLGKV